MCHWIVILVGITSSHHMTALRNVFGAATVGPLVVQHVTCDFTD